MKARKKKQKRVCIAAPDCSGVSIGGAEGEVETVPLKERLALYKAAISKEEKSTASVVMEDSEACSLPGGLASVKKQFESQKVSSLSQNTVTQYHYQQRQEVMSSSETSVRSSVRESHDIKMSQDQKLQQNVASGFENHFDEKVVVIGDQELAKISTQALKQQHEKNIEEAAPSKHIKKIRVPDNELCRVCRKRVYPMEALIADKQNFHKTCFRCAHCNSQLSLGNYAPLHGRIYCKPHYNQLFKSKGNYDEGFGEKPYRDFWSTKKQKNTSEKVNQVSPLPSVKSDTKESPVSKENEHFPAEMKESSMLDDNAKKSTSKIAIAWPPQSETPKKSFTLEEELKVVKPAWPPKEEATENTEPALQKKKVITNENQREHSDDPIKALPDKMVSEQPAPPQVQTDVSAAVEQVPKVAECNAQQGEQTDGQSEMKDKKEVLEMNGDYGGESNNVEKVKEHECENTKGNEEREETTGVKVTVIDGVATAEQPANGNANNNNNNNNNNHQLLDFGDPGLDMDDAKAESDILDFYSPYTQQSNTKEETIHKEGTNPIEETKTKEVTNTFEKTDSKAESDTKETMRANLLLLLQDDNRPPPSANEENLSDAKLEHHSDQQTNFSASQFLDDIFAGFGETTSFFPRDESSTKPSATLLDDLMDFGMETKEVSGKKTLENSCIDYSNSKAASCLWGDDLQSLSVEEQIKRNRYYDDDDEL